MIGTELCSRNAAVMQLEDYIAMPSHTKLLLNGRFLGRSMTGIDRVATELSMAVVARLKERGDDPLKIACSAEPTFAPESRPSALLALEKVPTPRLKGYAWEQLGLTWSAPGSWLLSFCNLGPILRSRQVVMIHDAQVFTQPQAYSKLFRLAYHTLLPRVARRAQVVLTVSDFSRRELENTGVVPPGKTIVVHNGVDHMNRITEDPTVLSQFELETGGYFLAIGSLAPHKNFPMLIAAAKARQDTSIPLIIAGGGNSKVFRDQGLTEEKGIRFLGRVSDSELKALYTGAKALVFPSKTEGFGLPPLEAMLCGCPVIATTGGAVPEVCGDAALYADPSKQAEWTAAMEKLTADTSLCDDLSHRGSAHATKFTWAGAADKILGAIAAAENDI